MASVVQHSLLCPLPGLGTLKSRSSNCDAFGEYSVGDIPGVQTPTSSADPGSERIDPVLLLARPVEGFNHPRQHLFTDRLLGRFYEDSSLDAETRKTSKCLAGRLGTAGSTATTRPSTTATAASHLRSSHSPTTTRRSGKRMHGSASARAIGRETVGAGLAWRKEQVQKEILEQKALIEKLEGRVASLSGRGARNAASRRSSALSEEDWGRDTSRRQEGTDDRPATTPESESMEMQPGSGDVENLGDKHVSAEQNQRGQHLPESGRGRAGSRSGTKSADDFSELADHGGSTAQRDSLCLSRESAACLGQQKEEKSAVAIQRNVRGTGRRKKFLTLQSAREDFEHHLQALLSSSATTLAQQQQQQQDSIGGVMGGGFGSRVNIVSEAAVRLLETSREDGLAKPPFEILRAMYSGIDDVTGALASLSSAEGKQEAGASADARGGAYIGGTSCSTTMTESLSMAKEALEAIREAVGAHITTIGKSRALRGASDASFTVVPRHHQESPVGSGRAAALAMASGRGGLLASPDVSPTSYLELPAGMSSTEGGEAGAVSLRTLDVEGVAHLLRTHGFQEHAQGFVAQAVDGVMLNDPNLCEADFAELGLGGGVAGAPNSRARMVSFFRRCQQSGAVFPDAEGSPVSWEEGVRPRPDARRTGDLPHDERRDDESSTGQSNPISSEESPWRRGSALVDRENQRVLAEIPLDSTHAGGTSMPTSTGNDRGRRISLKLNQGVVVTTGSSEVSLLHNTDDSWVSDAEDEATAAAGRGMGGASSAAQGGRRTSVGLPPLTFCKEPAGEGEGGGLETKGDLRLAPGVAVTTAGTAVDVFR